MFAEQGFKNWCYFEKKISFIFRKFASIKKRNSRNAKICLKSSDLCFSSIIALPCYTGFALSFHDFVTVSFCNDFKLKL